MAKYEEKCCNYILRETAVCLFSSFVCFAAVSLFLANSADVTSKPDDVKVVDIIHVMLIPKAVDIWSWRRSVGSDS